MYTFESDFVRLRTLDSASDEYQSIRDRLATSNINLVRSIAFDLGPKLGVNGDELNDLIGEGNLALLKAIDDFDPAKGTFPTFAGYRIQFAIQTYARDKMSIVHEPSWHHKKRIKEGNDSAPVAVECHGLPGQKNEDVSCKLDGFDAAESFVSFVEARATLDAFLEHLENKALAARGRQRDGLVRQRQVLKLHFASQTAIEIARKLDISMSNVSYHIKNGIADFRRFIDESDSASE